MPVPLDPLLDRELDRQADALVDLGYPALAGRDEASFRALVEPLRPVLHAQVPALVGPSAPPGPEGPIGAAFVLVVHRDLVPLTARVPLLSLAGRAGTLSRHFADVDSFASTVEVPEAPVYALVGVERGDEHRGVPPAEAVAALAGRGRTPLTVEEGMAFLHAFPDALVKNHCFHTAATRGGDRRVPALWIADRAPHLGWCWESNHHTWLGVASTAARVVPAGN